MRLAAILLTLAVSGCVGSTAAVPPDNYYRFRVVAPDQRAEKVALPGVLSVATLDGDGLVRARPVLFIKGEGSHALRQHNYHFWADSPTRLLQTELVSYLRRLGLAGSVVTPKMRVRADFELIGKIKRLERVLGSLTTHVAVELDFAIIRQSDRRLVVENTYAIEVDCDDDSVDSSVAALNLALEKLFAAFAADVARSSHIAAR